MKTLQVVVRRGRSLVWALLPALCAAVPAHANTPPPIEHFVRPPAISSAVISPSGDRVALIVLLPDGYHALAVMPLGSSDLRVISRFTDANILTVGWVNDQRLVFEAFKPGAVIKEHGAGTFAINADGTQRRQLISWRHSNHRTHSSVPLQGLSLGWFWHRTLDDGSDDILVRHQKKDDDGDATTGRLARLDTHTGRLKPLPENPPPFGYGWLMDAQGGIRVVATHRDGRHRIHWRAPGQDNWTVVLDQDSLAADLVEPRLLKDERTLVVEGRVAGRDTSALHTLSLQDGRLDSEPMLAVTGFDADAVVEMDMRHWRAVGVHTAGPSGASAWFDEGLALIQQAVDAALPGRVNRLSCGRCLSTRHFIVYSYNDREPGEYLHYDHENKTLRTLGRTRPWIDEGRQGRSSFHRVAARDGLTLPVYITHPPGQAPADLAQGAKLQALPTVVQVHGGPFVRGHSLRWSAEAQLLASRGYRVLQVEYRGSTGYGWQHFRAGWKQWGTGMQDDLADALAWAAAQGLTDPQRVCLMGYSYGGYAALMAPIRHPGLFRCAISGFGVTDPLLMYTAKWSDITEQSKRYFFPDVLGDPEQDAELLAAASPLKRVAELKLPVLLSYGGEDLRVPQEHAGRFLRAARAARVPVEVMPFPDEGHGWFKGQNHIRFLTRVESFLADALKKPTD